MMVRMSVVMILKVSIGSMRMLFCFGVGCSSNVRIVWFMCLLLI